MTAIALKRNVPGFIDDQGRFRPIRSASYVGSGTSRRKAKVSDRKKYSRAKAGDLGKAKQERALEAPWDREFRLEREAAARIKREQDRIEKQIAAEAFGETDRTSRGKAKTLAQFVRSEGGIRRTFRHGGKSFRGKVSSWDKGEIDRLSPKESGTTGLTTSQAGRGKTMDKMYQAAREAGYNVGSPDEMMQALESEIYGGKATYATSGVLTYNPAETVLWGIRKGAPEWAEELITSTTDPKRITAAKKWAKENGFDRFRTSKFDMSEKPDFAKTVRRNPIKILKHKFYVGQKLATRFIGDYDNILRGTVVSRTPKFVTVKIDGDRELKRCGISVFGNSEVIYPFGKYSMAPTFRAEKGDRVGNPKGKPSASQLAKAAISVFDNDLDLDVDARDVRRLQRGEKAIRRNPSGLICDAKGCEVRAGYRIGKRDYCKKHATERVGTNYVEEFKAKKNPYVNGKWNVATKGQMWLLFAKDGLTIGQIRKESGKYRAWTRQGSSPLFGTLAAAKKWVTASNRKSNPDVLGMFANAAVGIASALQIKEHMNRPKRKAAPKRRGTTTAKRKNPVSSRALNPAKVYYEMGNVGKAKYTVNFHDGKKTHRDGSPFFDIRIFSNKKLKDAFVKSLAGKGYSYRNPVSAAVPRSLNVLTVRTGERVDAVYLHDGKSGGFGKKFKTLSAAKSFATRNKIKLVENPSPKVNGVLSRALARAKAKREYGRELRAEAAAARARSRRQKAESKAKANPMPRLTADQKIFIRAMTEPQLEHTVDAWSSSKINAIAKALDKKGLLTSFGTLKSEGYAVAEQLRKQARKNPAKAKANPIAAIRKAYVRRYGDSGQTTAYVEWIDHKGKTGRTEGNPNGLHMKALLARAKREGVTVTKETWNPANPKRTNPKTTARRRTYEMFQGRRATKATPMMVSHHAPAKLDALGDLIELKIKGGPTLKFNRGVKLTAANGKLWIAGKRFAKPNPSAPANEINPIGEIAHVVYGTYKPHHGDHNYTHYIHKLGEESGVRPVLCVDREGFPVIRGGNYTIEARGIVD